MVKKRSQTQYCFNVDLRPRSELRGVGLLGHNTLAELHEAIADARGQTTRPIFSFRLGGMELEAGKRLDELNLKAGQTLEYIVYSVNGALPETIAVDFIEGE